MVKAIALLQGALRRVSALFQAITSAYSSAKRTVHSLTPSSQSKIPPQQVARKRKLITKKDMRLFVRRKLQKMTHEGVIDAPSEQGEQSSQSLSGASVVSSVDTHSVNKKFSAFLANNDEELICSVCRSLMLLPAATTCDHVFCLECIENSLVVSNRCPLCRATVATEDNYGISTLRPIQTLIHMQTYQQLSRSSREDSQEHRKREKENESWQKGRFIQEEELVVGCKIDVWKTDAREWKSAEVVLRQEDSLMVSYDHFPKEQNQIIELPSLRVARRGFYSSRYQTNDFTFPELHFRHSVRIGVQFEPNPNLFRRLNRGPNSPFPLPFMRRPVTLPLQAISFPPTITQTLSIRADSATSNPFNPFSQRTDPPQQQPQTLSLETDPPELDRLHILGPQVWQPADEPAEEPEEPERDESQLLPNLNPEFLRQAESSSDEQVQHLFDIYDDGF